MIPTAGEVLKKSNATGMAFNREAIQETMIEFAKLHVEAALKAAELEAFKFVDIDAEECYKPQIINSYPKELIK